VRAVVANLSRRIAEREIEKVTSLLSCSRECLFVEETRNSPGPGNIVFIEIASDGVTEVFSAFGRLGVPAEKVGDEVARPARVSRLACCRCGPSCRSVAFADGARRRGLVYCHEAVDARSNKPGRHLQVSTGSVRGAD
jgi:hypothetical protein